MSAAIALVTKNGAPMPPSQNAIQEAEAEKKLKQKQDAWNAYNGVWPDIIKPDPGQPNVNVKVNRCGPVVDTGVDFLCGRSIALEVLKEGKPAADAQAALDAVWGGNDDRRMVTLAKLAQNAAIFGQAYAKIIEPKGSRQPYCRIVPLDSSQVTVDTEPDDVDTVRRYTVTWCEKDLYGAEITHKQVTERIDPDADAEDFEQGYDPDSTWLITNWMRGASTSAAWRQVGKALTWDHPWAPVHDWQNMPLANSHAGKADITPDVIHLNGALNMVQTNINAIGKSHGMPWVYAAGTGLSGPMKVTPGNVIEFPSPDGKLDALEAHGDLAGLSNFASDLRSDIDEITHVPAVATGRAKDLPKATSGVAMFMLYGPLLARNTHKQRTHGDGWSTVSLRALSLQGYGDGTGMDGWEVRVKFQDPLPSDDVAQAQYVTALDGLGCVSQHTIVDHLKLDWDTEQEYLKEEAKAALKAALKGQQMVTDALPPADPAAPADPNADPNAPTPPNAPPVAGNPRGVPGGVPVNHPAAIAQRNLMSAMSH